MNPQRRYSLAITLATLTLGFTTVAFGQDYPVRPIRLIVPFAPGGAADTTARMVADALGKRLGQMVIVENKPGAGATVGAALVAAAAPDGYTVLYTTPGPQITNPFLMAKLSYNPDDLVPVTRVAWFPNVLVVTRSLPVHDVQGLIDYARKNPGKVNFASAGIGASSHLSGELFKTAANIDISHVPYKGTGQAAQDLVAGNVQMAIDSLSVYLPFIKSGQVRALGIAMPERSPLLPDVPTIADQLKGFDSTAVNYLTVPRGTPQSVIDRLSREVAAVLADRELSARMIDMGLVPRASTPAEMAAEVQAERTKWQKVIQDSGAKPE
ncbi:MAG: tripartite tricarboxylate transporter substrate binding protein [Burkholderiales bacterium]